MAEDLPRRWKIPKGGRLGVPHRARAFPTVPPNSRTYSVAAPFGNAHRLRIGEGLVRESGVFLLAQARKSNP